MCINLIRLFSYSMMMHCASYTLFVFLQQQNLGHISFAVRLLGFIAVDSRFVLPLYVGFLCLVIVLLCSTSFPFQFYIISMMKRKLVALL